MKKWAKFLCCFALLGAFLVGGLAGCTSVSNITNKNAELIYNGDAAALVKADNGDFLYFANAYSSTAPTSKEEYASAKKISYLARVNADKLESKNEYFSPKNMDNISEEVVGYEDSFMFVLGQNIYYATPNTKMVNVGGNAAYHFEYVCLYKSALDGTNRKELYRTFDVVSKIEVLKHKHTYYVVMLAGDKLITINLSNEQSATLATGVTSVALPKTYRKDINGSTLDWNGQIYFTISPDNESGSGSTRNIVKKIDVSSTKEDDAKMVYNQSSVTFVARERDVLFFTDKVGSSQSALFCVDMTNPLDGNFLSSSENRKTVLDDSSITASNTQFYSVTLDGKVLGYVFKVNSTNPTFRYFTLAGKKGTFTFSEDMSNATILFVSERTMYLATSTALYRAKLEKVFSDEVAQCIKFAEMTGISNDAPTAFDGEYLYFYSTLQEIPENLKDQDENAQEGDEQEEEETDENLYLHRARVFAEVTAENKGQFELLARTAIESRRTK